MDFFDTNFGIFLVILGQCLLVTLFLLVSLAFLIWVERKTFGLVQLRKSVNVVGPFGLLQSFADFIKMAVKEVVIPAGADKAVFLLAPLISFVLVLIAWAAVPFYADDESTWILSDINVGILYIFAISSLEVYGVIMGGWASNSKYPFLGGLRSAAQMISYEVSIGFIIVGVLISTGSLSLTNIVAAQDGDYGFFSWYWLPHLPMVFLFFISALAETNRPPFDLPEAESELVAGYQVEYSSTLYLLYMIGEYMAMLLLCALTTTLFFGGWLSPIPGLPDGVFWFVAKTVFFFFLFALVKAVVPRYRYDQLMRLGWKVFLPMSLAWVVIVAAFAQFGMPGYARWDASAAPVDAVETAQADCTALEGEFRDMILADDASNADLFDGFPPLQGRSVTQEVQDVNSLRVLVLQLYQGAAMGLQIGLRDDVMGAALLMVDPLVECYARTHEGFDDAGRDAYRDATTAITPEQRLELLEKAREAVQ